LFDLFDIAKVLQNFGGTLVIKKVRELQGVQKVMSLALPSLSLSSCSLGIWQIDVAHSGYYSP
jgi:hypothetical protein